MYVKASASIHRNILQQLEKMLLIEPDRDNGLEKRKASLKTGSEVFYFFCFSGRRITARGQKDLDQIAGQVKDFFRGGWRM